jgi:hypothetical protein
MSPADKAVARDDARSKLEVFPTFDIASGMDEPLEGLSGLICAVRMVAQALDDQAETNPDWTSVLWSAVRAMESVCDNLSARRDILHDRLRTEGGAQ